MTLEEAIKARHSVRAYKAQPLAEEIVKVLEKEIEGQNCQGHLHIQLIKNEPKAFQGKLAKYGKFSNVTNYLVMAGQKAEDLDERIGYYGEHLVLLAQTLGLHQLVSEARYTETIFLKTSVLFAAAAAGGALVGGAKPEVVEAINKYALDMGLGFQMYDDYLGIAGDSSKTGKSVGNDLRKGKCTLMVTYTLENLKDEAKLAKFKSILGNMDASEAEVREGMQIMKDIGAIEYNKKAAEDKIASAKAYLSILPESEDKEFMLALADYAINREV